MNPYGIDARRSRMRVVMREKLTSQLAREHRKKTGIRLTKIMKNSLRESIDNLCKCGTLTAESSHKALREIVSKQHQNEGTLNPLPPSYRPHTALTHKKDIRPTRSNIVQKPTADPNLTTVFSDLWPTAMQNPRKARLLQNTSDGWACQIKQDVKNYDHEIRKRRSEEMIRAKQHRLDLDMQVKEVKERKQQEKDADKVYALAQKQVEDALLAQDEETKLQEKQEKIIARQRMRSELTEIQNQKASHTADQKQRDAIARIQLQAEVENIQRRNQLRQLAIRRAHDDAAAINAASKKEKETLIQQVQREEDTRLAECDRRLQLATRQRLEDKVAVAERQRQLLAFGESVFNKDRTLLSSLSLQDKEAEAKAHRELSEIDKRFNNQLTAMHAKREALRQMRHEDLQKQFKLREDRRRKEREAGHQRRLEMEQQVQDYSESISKQKNENHNKMMVYVTSLRDQVCFFYYHSIVTILFSIPFFLFLLSLRAVFLKTDSVMTKTNNLAICV